MSDARSATGAGSVANGGEPSDEALLAGLVAGRLESLETLYDRYKTMAYGIARRITADDALAEDEPSVGIGGSRQGAPWARGR